MRLTYHTWTIRQLNELKRLADLTTIKEASKLLKVPEFSVKNACHMYGIRFEKKNHFKKGMRPWNKGIKKPYKGGEETQFKKGNLPHNTKFDGFIRIQPDKSGRCYKYIRISLGKWMPLHRYVWLNINGDPGNNIIRFKDGDTMNCNIENLTMISRGENARLNALIRKPRTKRKLIAY